MNDMASINNQRQQNLINRANLILRAPKKKISLGVKAGQTAALGTTSFMLANTGIATSIRLLVSATYTVGVAQATLSPKAPYNLINKISLRDFNGNNRVLCSGHQLFCLLSKRKRSFFGANNEGAAQVLPLTSTPVAVGAQTMYFYLDVPLAFNEDSDLRGAMFMQVTGSAAYLDIDWNPLVYANANDEAVFNGAGTTTVTAPVMAVEAIQTSYVPYAGMPLPNADLITNYLFEGGIRSTDNITVGGEKIFFYPTNRSVIGFFFNYIQGGVMLPGTDLTRVKEIQNSLNTIYDVPIREKLITMREYLNGDLKNGSYFNDHQNSPIVLSDTGLYQCSVIPAVVGATPSFETAFESFVVQNTQLPQIAS